MATWSNAPTNDVDFHKWLAERNRHRASRLAWTLVVVLLAAGTAIALLVVQLDDLNGRLDAARGEIQLVQNRVERIERVTQRVTAGARSSERRAEKRAACLERRVSDLSKGVRALLRADITPAGYLRKYSSLPRC